MVSTPTGTTCDVAVIGGGIVGASVAWGLARNGARVTVLDEGDNAFRASRGNFALVWVQGKGLGMTPYAQWTRASADLWPQMAAALREETGIDVGFERPGGFKLCLSDQEQERLCNHMRRLNAQQGIEPQPFESLNHAQTRGAFAELGPTVVGSIYSPLDGHVNSLRLFHALHMALSRNRVDYRSNSMVGAICPVADGFLLTWPGGTLCAAKVVLAAGLGNAKLGPMVGLDAPVRPVKGQIIVTEKAAPFLRHPVITLRQSDEGSVMIGESQQEAGFATDVDASVISVMAARAVRMFPVIGGLNVVRTWAALRVMSPDGFPIYEQSRVCPGAFIATCHSGVTLAAAHALVLAPCIAHGKLPLQTQSFDARRFHVPQAA